MKTTITEALAELKTISKRIEKKQGFIAANVARQEGLKDPLAKDGGSVTVIERELQSIDDLLKRHVAIRMAIQRVNQATYLTIGDAVMSIAEWLTWRKEVAPTLARFNKTLQDGIRLTRDQAQKKGYSVVAGALSVSQADGKPTDVVINVDEKKLADRIEEHEQVLGTLDGLLSLKNATVMIELED